MRGSMLVVGTAVLLVLALVRAPCGYSQNALQPMASSTASGGTLWVTNYGVDNAACGSRPKPCRSISQAVDNAAEGDTIWVGAGHYGNVSGDPSFAGPGDEHASTGTSTVGGADDVHGCVLCIGKAVRIYSLHGASVTTIAGIPSSPFEANVMILHDGVVFGAIDHGFAIGGGARVGLTIGRTATRWPRGVTVAGNIDVRDETGFLFEGLSAKSVRNCPEGVCAFTGRILLSANKAIANTIGFRVVPNGDWAAGSIVLSENASSGAANGFLIEPGSGCGCMQVDPTFTVQLLSNIAARGGTGFSINYSAAPIRGNTAIDNANSGFRVDAPVHEVFHGNSALGNGGPGLIVNFSSDPFTLIPDQAGFSNFSENNFWGNDRRRPVLGLSVGGLPAYDPGPSSHCGVLNVGALAAFIGPVAVRPPPTIKVQAPGNFWGSPNGPIASGSGDAVGGACDQNGGVTVAKPFATQPFGINSLP